MAHLAIVVVFLLAALEYGPFRGNAADAVQIRETHRIDHEAANAVVRPLSGVRSTIWLDDANLAVTVADDASRTLATVDRVCNALAPLGDTRAVVVHLRGATNPVLANSTLLSRSCRL